MIKHHILKYMKGGILKDDEGISPVIGTVLILAIGVTVITTVQLNFVPVWNAQEELNHLEKMNGELKELKSSIESSAVSGTALSSSLSMGFRYSPKLIAYNPRESAYAKFSIQKDTWAELRYNEILPDGMDDAQSIKNITSSTITYSLQSPQNLNPFVYEHGLIRRGGSNYTASAQTLVTNNSLYLLGVNVTEPETTSSLERRGINIYPTSPAKNSVIGKNVWLTLHTKYVEWWTDPNNPSSIQNLGGTIMKKDSTGGTIIAYFDRMEIRMGETQVTTRSKKPPERLPAYRLVKITPQNVNLAVIGMNSLVVEVQDFYNNPVPNVLVNFSINTTRKPGNAYLTATLLQNSAISGADGRATIQLKTSGAGIYYIDARAESVPSVTFAYPASSQGGFISLTYAGSDPAYTITATLKDGNGDTVTNKKVSFDTSEGTVTPSTVLTDPSGNATATLDITGATGLKIKDVDIYGVTKNSVNITWDTINTITVTANRTSGGYVFNTMDVPTMVTSSGCVWYGTSPGAYSFIKCSASPTSSHSISLTGLQPYTAYYFIINSSRPGGAGVNSSEYMFVTEYAVEVDTTPPASVTALNNVTYAPLYIRWTWTDPADSDFDHVEVYIDGVSNGTVAKGVQSFNSSYFRPNSSHTISTRTVDTSGNVNATWNNRTANTSSVFTYVFDFLNTTGTVTNFPAAQNASDGGASAQFTEALTGGTSESHDYTNVSGYTPAKGTVTNFANMQTALDGGAFATMTEGASTLSMSNMWWFNTTTESWVSNYTTTGGTVTMAFTGADGNPAGSIYSKLVGDNVALRQATTTWTSPNFTWTNGTPFAASLYFDWTVATYTNGNPGNYYVLLVRPDNSTIQIYPTTAYSATSAWSTLSNTTISTSDFSQSGNYSIKLVATLATQKKGGNPTVEVRWDNPVITLNRTSYSLDITTKTTSIPVDTNYYLEIKYSRDVNDTYDVYAFNGTAWNLKGSLTSLLWSVFNTTIDSSEVINGNMSLRYLDQNPAGLAQGGLYIDYQRIHGNTHALPAAYRLSVTTNITSIPDASTQQILQIGYNVSGDNFTLQIWNGSAWNNRITLNDSALSYRNIILLPEEFIPSGSLTGGAGTVATGYVLVRYLDVNASVVQQGRLYIDYQRVYSI